MGPRFQTSYAFWPWGARTCVELGDPGEAGCGMNSPQASLLQPVGTAQPLHRPASEGMLQSRGPDGRPRRLILVLRGAGHLGPTHSHPEPRPIKCWGWFPPRYCLWLGSDLFDVRLLLLGEPAGWRPGASGL